MAIFAPPAHGASGVDTGDIGHSLRFRRSASAYISTGVTTAATSTYFCFFKQGAIDAVNPIFDGNIKINANNTITAFGLTTSAVKRDPTSQHWIHVSNNGLVFDGVNLGAVTTSAITSLRIGYDGTNYADMYGARMCCVSGSSLAYTDFVYFNSTINEWVCKSQSAIKSLVDAGGSASFMYDFDDSSSLTTLGYDKSSKGNNATLNNFSLTAGTTYDHMLDVPGNSFATLNPLFKSTSAAAPADGNLKYGSGNYFVASNVVTEGKWYWEAVWASGTGTYLGVVAGNVGCPATAFLFNSASYLSACYYNNGTKYLNGTNTAYGATYATGDVIGAVLDMDATPPTIEFFKNNVSQGVITLTTTTSGYSPALSDSGAGCVVNYSFGQAPLHASATYHSAAGGYFRYAPPTGYKALCQRNMPDPAILNPKSGFVSAIATEDNIYSTLAAARSGWTDYVDILKNRAASESWAWQFSHDSSNEYAVAASSLVRQTKRTQSGSNNWVGYSIRIGSTYGTAAGSVSHTNGAATTITHNVGKSARQLILLFNRAGGSAVPVYHPDLTSGELLDLCTGAADAASTVITSVGTNSFQIGSATATGTYDYLVCSELSGLFDLGKYSGNGTASNGPYIDIGGKPSCAMLKNMTTGATQWSDFDAIRSTYNVVDKELFPSGADVENVRTTAMDFLGFGIKIMQASGTWDNNLSGNSIVTATWMDVAGKYSLGR